MNAITRGFEFSDAHLRKQRPVVFGLLDAVGDESLHGFGTALVEFTEVRGQIASPNHKDDLQTASGNNFYSTPNYNRN